MSIFFDLFRHEPNFLSVKQGNFLFKEGDRSKELMFVLISGSADIIVGDKVVEQASAGTIVGEMGIISPQEKRTATVVCTTDCEYAEIDLRRFNYLVTEAPHFALEIMRVLASRLRNTDQMINC
jgi:CRP-like cAMP-binding protein